MKKVIDGALYNTDTANELGSWNNHQYGSFGYCEETLYRTKSGKYFIYGTGGARSKYSQSCGNNMWGSGEHIEPVVMTEAVRWAEENLDGDEYIAAFGEPEEASDEREALNITIPVDLKSALDRLKSETGKSISALICDAVRAQYNI